MNRSLPRRRVGSWVAAVVALVLLALPTSLAFHDHDPALAGRADPSRTCAACLAIHAVAIVVALVAAATTLAELGAAEFVVDVPLRGTELRLVSIRGPPVAS